MRVRSDRVVTREIFDGLKCPDPACKDCGFSLQCPCSDAPSAKVVLVEGGTLQAECLKCNRVFLEVAIARKGEN